ncbi:MAG: IclR family transcriptional regulator [Thermodesulfobacteriota bacterium]
MNRASAARALSLSRGLDVLEILAKSKEELSFNDIIKGLEIPSSSLWRVLQVLRQRGYVHFDERKRTYRMGFQFLYMGNILMNGFGYRSLAREYLKRLSEESGETTELDVRMRDQLILIDQVEGPDAIRLYSHPGSVIPYFHATAPGKVYLAHMEREKLRSAVKKLGLPRLTIHTIHLLEQLEKEIDEVKIRGYAYDFEELREGVCRISAPIYDRENRVLGCFTIACPSFRLDKHIARKDDLGLLVKQVAFEFSKEHGRLQ